MLGEGSLGDQICGLAFSGDSSGCTGLVVGLIDCFKKRQYKGNKAAFDGVRIKRASC